MRACAACGGMFPDARRKGPYCSLKCAYEAARVPGESKKKESGPARRKGTAVLKISPRRLPKPALPATKPYRGMTPEDAELKRLYEASKRQQEAEEQFANRKRNTRPNDCFTAEEDAAIRRMSKEGKSLKEIARELGRPYPSVVKRKRRLDVDDSGFSRFLEGLL